MLTTRTHRLIASLKPRVSSSPLRPGLHLSRSLFHTSPIQCKKGNPTPKNDPIAEFFARFPDFNYNPDRTWPEEWKRLCQNIEEQLQRAAIERFESTYSFDPSDLAAWHKMCRVLGIVPPPPTDKACRKAIKRIYVNLIDLEHAGHKGNAEVVQKFPTEVELSEYTKNSRKIYRRNLVPDGSLLELLLRHILDPQPGKVETSRNGKRAKGSIIRACSGP